MRAWPVARSIFDAPYVREANERPTRLDKVLRGSCAAQCLFHFHEARPDSGTIIYLFADLLEERVRRAQSDDGRL